MPRKERVRGQGTRDVVAAKDKGIPRDKGRRTRDKGTANPAEIAIVRSGIKVQMRQGLKIRTDRPPTTNQHNKQAQDPRFRKRIILQVRGCRLWVLGCGLWVSTTYNPQHTTYNPQHTTDNPHRYSK
jgi:hypothetical protein